MQLRSQYPRRKRIRLPAAAYAETAAICSATIATQNRSPILASKEFASAWVDLLLSQASQSNIIIHAYCLMPDHAHLLLSPSASMSIIEFVRRFKSLSTRLAWDRGHDGLVWQQGFYDHFLRRDEDLGRAIDYILNNPVRAGLAADATAYPFSGPLSLKDSTR